MACTLAYYNMATITAVKSFIEQVRSGTNIPDFWVGVSTREVPKAKEVGLLKAKPLANVVHAITALKEIIIFFLFRMAILCHLAKSQLVEHHFAKSNFSHSFT